MFSVHLRAGALTFPEKNSGVNRRPGGKVGGTKTGWQPLFVAGLCNDCQENRKTPPARKPRTARPLLGPTSFLTMTDNKGREYCLIVEGAYLTEGEAEHALRDPFIEDWVEQTGHFKIHNMNDIQVTPGVTLGSLGVVMLDDRVFEIASVDPEHPLTEHKAKGVAEALRRQDMFDEVNVEPREEELSGASEQ